MIPMCKSVLIQALQVGKQKDASHTGAVCRTPTFNLSQWQPLHPLMGRKGEVVDQGRRSTAYSLSAMSSQIAKQKQREQVLSLLPLRNCLIQSLSKARAVRGRPWLRQAEEAGHRQVCARPRWTRRHPLEERSGQAKERLVVLAKNDVDM